MPGRRAAVERALAADEVARLARRFARPRRVDGLERSTRLATAGFSSRIRAELVVDDRLDDALDLGVAELRLGLALELRPRNLDADDGGQALADVVAADVRVLQILGEVVLAGVVVDRPRQRRAEAGEVRAAFVRVDVVREGVDRLGVAVVPLQRDLDVDAVLLAVHVDRLVVDRRLVLVQVLDERDDARLRRGTCALLPSRSSSMRDGDAAVQERELAQPLRQRVEAELGRLEDLRVGLERDLRAALLRRAGDLEIAPSARRARSVCV